MRPAIVVINCKATSHGELVEFGAITLSATLCTSSKYSSLIKPTKEPVAIADPKCSVTPGMLKTNVPEFKDVADDIFKILHGKIWVGHGVIYFQQQLEQAFRTLDKPQSPQYRYLVDTNILLSHDATLKNMLPQGTTLELESLADAFGFQHEGRALEDAKLTLDIFRTYSTIATLERCFGADTGHMQQPIQYGYNQYPGQGNYFESAPVVPPAQNMQVQHYHYQYPQSMMVQQQQHPATSTTGQVQDGSSQQPNMMNTTQETPAKQPEALKSTNETAAAAPATAEKDQKLNSQQTPENHQQRLGTITTEPSARMPAKTDEKTTEEKPSTPAKPSFAALVRKNSTKKAAKPTRASLSHTPKAVEVERSLPSSGSAPTAGGEANQRPTNDAPVAPQSLGTSNTDVGATGTADNSEMKKKSPQKTPQKPAEKAVVNPDGWVVAGQRVRAKRDIRKERRSKDFKMKKLTEAINNKTRVWVLLKNNSKGQNQPQAVHPLSWSKRGTVVVQSSNPSKDANRDKPAHTFFLKVENIIELREQPWSVGGGLKKSPA